MIKWGLCMTALTVFFALDFTTRIRFNDWDNEFDMPTKNLKFIHITKNGGTTIEEIGHSFGIEWGKYHKEYGFQHNILIKQPHNLRNRYNWFMVVRNPFDRLISEFHCLWGGVGDYAQMFNSFQFNWYIREKIRQPEKIKLGPFSGHYVPQSRYIVPQLMNPHPSMNSRSYNPILRFEHLGEDFDALMKVMGLEPRFADQKPNDQTGHKKYFSPLDFDNETLRLILDIYDEDFKMFNYSRNPADAKYSFEVDRVAPVSTKNVEDYKIFIRTPQNVTFEELTDCFRERHNGISIFKDDGEKIRKKAKNNSFLHFYTPQDLSDVYLWRISQRWKTTTELAEADIVLLLHFPVISEHAGWCNGVSHADRQESVIDWAAENVPANTTTAIVCPSSIGCDGIKIIEKLGSKVKILMKERNPKWLFPRTGRDNKTPLPPHLTEMVNDPNRTIIIPYTAHRNLKRIHKRLLEIPDEDPFDAPTRCNSADTSAPWCDGKVSNKKDWKNKSMVFYAGDTRNQPVREVIQTISERENVMIANTHLIPNKRKKDQNSEVPFYARYMMRARFCICPRGDTPTSRRLFDSIVAGCLPIVISDDIDKSLPFSDIIPYDLFWFRVKEAEWINNPNAVLDRIQAVPEEEIGRRLRIMQTYVPLLDWTNTAFDTGFRTIIEEIMKADSQ